MKISNPYELINTKLKPYGWANFWNIVNESLHGMQINFKPLTITIRVGKKLDSKDFPKYLLSNEYYQFQSPPNVVNTVQPHTRFCTLEEVGGQ